MNLSNQGANVKKGSLLKEIYASFFLNDTELAICVEHLQEVVNYPPSISPMPLGPNFVQGVFNLRSMIIPILDLKILLHLPPGADRPSKVAILNFGGARIGLALDRTGEVLRPKADEISTYAFSKESTYKVIQGAIKLSRGERLLQVLSPEALFQIENVPQFSDTTLDSVARQVSRIGYAKNRKKCITFSVGNTKLAFEITDIHEIINVPNLQSSPFQSELCLGMTQLRGNVIPVISFQWLLYRTLKNTENIGRDERIIILRLEKETIGLHVNRVDTISSFATDQLMPIPLLSPDRAEMFRGCLTIPELGEVILLEPKKVLSNNELMEITHGHSKIYQTETSDTQTTKSTHSLQTFIAFRLNHLFGFPIKAVREIIRNSDSILETPGIKGALKGMINLRGKLVSIVDGRELYGIKEATDLPIHSRKIIVIEAGQDQIGLLVDDVENILHSKTKEILKVPDLISGMAEGEFQSDIQEVIDLSAQGKTASLIVLNTQALIARIKALQI